MPTHKQPSNDAALLGALRTAVAAGQQDTTEGMPYLSEAEITEITDVSQRFEAINAVVNSSLTARMRAVERAKQALSDLRNGLKLVWWALHAEIGSGKISPTYYSYFGLPQSGKVPQKGTRIQWLDRGANVLSGYERMMQEGHTLPISIDLLRQNYDAAAAAHREVQDLEGQVQVAQRERRRLRRDAEDACQLVVSRLRHVLRRESAEHTRAVMRRYGATFVYAPGEEDLAQAEAPDGMASEDAEPAISDITAGDTAVRDTDAHVAARNLDRTAALQSELVENEELHQNGATVTE